MYKKTVKTKNKIKKIKVSIDYWGNVSHLTTKEEIKKTEIWLDTEEEIFKKFDKQNNKLKYCNGSYLKFKDVKLLSKYNKWYNSLDKNTQFNMYYGNGVID